MKVRTSPIASSLRVAACVVGVLCLLPEKTVRNLFTSVELEQLSGARISTAYALDDRTWTTVLLPAAERNVKVVTNAVAATPLSVETAHEHQYSTRYQVTDMEGRLLVDRVYWQKTRQREYFDPETGRTIASKFFVGEAGHPLPTRSFNLNLRGLPAGPLRLRLQMGPRFEEITGVIARVYTPDDPPPYKLRYLWQRMSSDKQDSLARGNLYPTELTTEEERRNLVRNRWTPVAPLGIAGSDYQVRKLYSVQGEQLEEERQETIIPAGIYMSREVTGVLPLPAEGGEVRLEFEELATETGEEPLIVHFNHYGQQGHAVESSAANLDTDGMVIYRQVTGGVLEMLAPRELVVTAYLESDPSRPEITPPPAFVPAYLLAPGRAFDLKIARFWREHTPYRVDVRQVFSAGDVQFQARPVPLLYHFLDEEGMVLDSGFLVHEKSLSRHDVLVGSFAGYRVTEPSRHYLAVPSGTRTLRLLSMRDDLAISAFTRPADLLRRVRVPEDSYAFYRTRDEQLDPGEESARTWFLVRPIRGATWAREGLEAFVRVQGRPPAGGGSEALDQEFEPHVLHPLGFPAARQIIAEAESDDLEVIVGAGHRYIEVPNGHEVLGEFHGKLGDDAVAPGLICLKDDHSLASLRVFLDGALHFQATLASQATELEIPEFGVGPHRLSVVAGQNATILVSNASGSRGEMHLRRTVYRLDDEPLEIQVEKTTPGREVLSVWVYMPAGTDERALVRTRIELPAAARSPDPDSWTFEESRFEIRGRDGQAVRVLASDEPPLRAGYRFSLALGSDLRVGSYRVSLERDGGPVCFVHIAKLVPTTGDRRSVFLERALAPEESSR